MALTICLCQSHFCSELSYHSCSGPSNTYKEILISQNKMFRLMSSSKLSILTRGLVSSPVIRASPHLHLGYSRQTRCVTTAESYSFTPPKPELQHVHSFHQAKTDLLKWRRENGVTLLLISAILIAGYVVFAHEMEEKRLRDTLKKGTCPQSSITSSYFVDRRSSIS